MIYKTVCNVQAMTTPTQHQQALADLLKARREELDLSQTQVAAKVRQLLGGAAFTQQSYAAIESGKTKHSKYLSQIARALDLPPSALDPSAHTGDLHPDEQATILRNTGRKLPVIGSVAAGAWCEAVDLFQPGDAEDWIDSPGPAGPRAFVLRIEGVSMHNPGNSVSFADGDLVVVDPDLEALPGHFVVAKLSSSDRVTFKRLVREDGEWFLEAINPNWVPKYIRMSEEWHICGRALWKVQRI